MDIISLYYISGPNSFRRWLVNLYWLSDLVWQLLSQDKLSPINVLPYRCYLEGPKLRYKHPLQFWCLDHSPGLGRLVTFDLSLELSYNQHWKLFYSILYCVGLELWNEKKFDDKQYQVTKVKNFFVFNKISCFKITFKKKNTYLIQLIWLIFLKVCSIFCTFVTLWRCNREKLQ